MAPAVQMERSVTLADSKHSLDRAAHGTPRTGTDQGHFVAVVGPTIWDISGTRGVAFSCDDNGRAARGGSGQDRQGTQRGRE
jgi:hypothetical protein